MNNLRNSIYKIFREPTALVTLFLALITVFLACATFWQAWETRKLKQADLGPNISVADTFLEIVDDTGTPRKRISWERGELLNEKAISFKPGSANLSIKFLNTGKNSGYIKLLNFTELENKLVSKIDDFGKEFQLVPAGKESGYLYGLNILNQSFVEDKNIKLTYIFGTYNQTLSLINKFDITIQCFIKDKQFGGSAWFCLPINN